MLGDLGPEETLEVLVHLLPGCGRCQEVTSVFWSIGTDPDSAPDGWWTASGRFAYDGSMDRVFGDMRRAWLALERERAEASVLVQELTRSLAARGGERMEDEVGPVLPRFHTWGVCELLLQQSRIGGAEEPRRAAWLAEVAIAVAGRLDPGLYPLAMIETLQARAWGTLGNARRILSDFRGAEEAFDEADVHLTRGGGELLEKGSLLDLRASLRNAQGRTAEATRLLDRAVAVFRRIGQQHLVGRALISQGYVRVCAGDGEAAVEALRRGLALADTGSEPRLALAAQHCLAYLLNDMGRTAEAGALLARNRRLYEEHGDRMDLVRYRYLQGRIAAAAGEAEAAEAAFLEVRQAFLDAGIGCDAALTSLDLAALYVRQGRMAEVRTLAAEMVAVFRSHEVHREAMAALGLFRQAAESDSVTSALVLEVSGHLQRARRQF
jgi:tetratricopeptide (TPR) repeat protein